MAGKNSDIKLIKMVRPIIMIKIISKKREILIKKTVLSF